MSALVENPKKRASETSCAGDLVIRPKIQKARFFDRPDLPIGLRVYNKPQDGVEAESLVCSPDTRDFSESLWTCPICLGVPRYPASLANCGHVGCDGCLDHHLRSTGTLAQNQREKSFAKCPTCRAKFDRHGIMGFKGWNLPAKAMFGQIKVRCPSKQECTFVGTIAQLIQHEQFECRYRIIRCPNKGCSLLGSEVQVREHHYRSCPRLMVHCPTCKIAVPWESREQHDCYALSHFLIGGTTSHYNSVVR